MKRKVIAVLLAGTMAAGLLEGCGVYLTKTNTTDSSTDAQADDASEEEEEPAEDAEEEVAYSNKQVVVSYLIETSGDYTPMWTNNGSDYAVYKMITGMETVSHDEDGKWLVNPTVVENCEETENEDGSKTYTFTIK